MKRVTSFDPIPGLTGVLRPDGQELVLQGPDAAINRAKAFLTAEDASVKYQIKRLKDKRVKSEAEARWVTAEIDRLKPQALVHYFAHQADGSLSCPPGFWWLAAKCAAVRNTEITMHPLPDIYEKTLRPYQVEAVQALLQHKRGMLELSTGLGKTAVTVSLCHSAIQSGKRPLVVVPTIDLVEQTVKELRKAIPGTCGIGGTYKFKEGAPCAVTTIASAKGYSDMFNVIVLDECHLGASDTYSAAVLLSGATHAYGLTATPVRADDLVLGIHALCGPVVYTRDARWGIENGFLAPASVFMMKVPSGKGAIPEVIMQAVAYRKLCEGKRALTLISDTLRALEEKGMKTLVLYKTKEPGETLARFHNERFGTKHMVAHSGFRHPFRQFKEGTTSVLISNSALLGTGVDVPNIDAIISVVNSSGEAITRQVLGRGLRPSPGKERLYFFDVVLMGYGYKDKFDGYGYNRQQIYLDITDDVKVITI